MPAFASCKVFIENKYHNGLIIYFGKYLYFTAFNDFYIFSASFKYICRFFLHLVRELTISIMIRFPIGDIINWSFFKFSDEHKDGMIYIFLKQKMNHNQSSLNATPKTCF